MLGPPRALTPHGWELSPGGRVPHWDMGLPGLQLLGHYDPVQHGTRFVDGYVETESSAPQILKESCYERMVTLKPTSAHSRQDGDLFACQLKDR